eukprot:7545_1
MGYDARALCLAIWRVSITNRYMGAPKSNTLYTAVNNISVNDVALEDSWDLIATFTMKTYICDVDLRRLNELSKHSQYCVYGFVREYQQILGSKICYTIPTLVYQICLAFYAYGVKNDNDQLIKYEKVSEQNNTDIISTDSINNDLILPDFDEKQTISWLRPKIGWLEKTIDIAILQLNPIEID